MVKRNIVIFENNILYQIFFEIKNNFYFEIINCSSKDIVKLNLDNSIILSNFIQKDFLFKSKNINKSNIIFLLKKNDDLNYINNNQYIYYPLNISTLVEKINIEFIKQKYNDQSSISIENYLLDLNSRTISNNGNQLKLTEREVDIILFLKDQEIPQKVNILQNQIWGYSSELETHTVETHIYRLRKKFFETFNDKNFIISNEHGYIIK